MGYYSFYKIIKDIIFTIIKPFKNMSKRTLTIIIVFLLVFSLLSLKNKSAAHSDYYDSLQAQAQAFNCSHWCLYKRSDGKYYAVFNNKKIYSVSSGDKRLMFSNNGRDNDITQMSVYEFDTTTGQIITPRVWYGYGYSSSYNVYSEIIDINYSIYQINSPDTILVNVNDFLFKNPFIVNDSSSINNWDFDYLSIDSGSVSYYYNTTDNSNISQPYLIDLSITYNGINYVLDCNDYIDWENTNRSKFYIKLPRPYISSEFNFVSNSSISFSLILHKYLSNGEFDEDISYLLNDYNFTLADDVVSSINSDSNKYVISNINNNINNSNVNDDNVSNFSNIDNGMVIQDNTSINDIFDRIYTAFTTKYNDNNIGYGYTLSLPVPFTDKTIDISPHTVFGRSWADLHQSENKYSYEAVQVIYRFVGTIWWFVIGSFILKDVRSMINKVAEGNIEDVGSDIKKEML